MYKVTYSKAHSVSSEIGQGYDTWDDALRAARRAGAVGKGEQISKTERVYSVAGHGGSANYAIWITDFGGE